ncbi:GNAT family N-acetyltransferase [Glycomyces halotolerans]
MAELIAPTERLGESFSAAVDEWIAEGRGGPDDHTLVGEMIREHVLPAERTDWLIDFLEHERRWETDPPQYFVPMTLYWWVDGEEFLGRISVRHRLNDRLFEIGGHIGYEVRPTARRRGHATAMLAATLPRAADLGIEKALVTCDHDNIASRKVIERNGGVFEDRRGKKLRFWVPTTPDNAADGRARPNAR